MYQHRMLVVMICVSSAILSGSGVLAGGKPTNTELTPASAPPSMQGIAWVEAIKDVAQVFFWVTVAVVSIVTYIRARKTILQPLRTEVFKLQLEEMKKVLALFLGKRELDLREAFGLYKLAMANAIMMYDAYAHRFFDIKVDQNKRPYANSECPVTVFTKDAMRNCTLMDGYVRDDPPAPEMQATTDPRVRAALWAQYCHEVIPLPREYTEMDDRIQHLMENPLLPSQCVKLLSEYKETVSANIDRLKVLLTDCAKEMPEKYPSEEALRNASLDWIRNRFNDGLTPLKPKADAIVTYIRSSYEVDNLLTA